MDLLAVSSESSVYLAEFFASVAASQQECTPKKETDASPGLVLKRSLHWYSTLIATYRVRRAMPGLIS